VAHLVKPNDARLASSLMFHARGLAGDDESRRLLHVHFLGELSVEERRLHVQVMDLAAPPGRQSQQQAHVLHARHQRKDFLKVDAFALHESFGDEPRLVPHHLAALVPLHLVDPLEPDRLATDRRVHKLPCAILLHRRHLFQHRRPPALLLLCCGEACRLLCAAQVQLEIVQHTGRLPWRTCVADEVDHRAEPKRLAGVLRVDVRGGARWRRDEVDQRCRAR